MFLICAQQNGIKTKKDENIFLSSEIYFFLRVVLSVWICLSEIFFLANDDMEIPRHYLCDVVADRHALEARIDRLLSRALTRRQHKQANCFKLQTLRAN